MEAVNLAVVMKLAKKAMDAWEKDQDHSVRLNKLYFVGTFNPVVFGKKVPDWNGKNIVINNLKVWAVPTPIGEKSKVDGATGMPDKPFGIDYAPSYFPHDNGYLDMDAIALDPVWIAEGWDIESIRKLFDAMFGCINKELARRQKKVQDRVKGKLLARVTYAGVRWLGGIFHRVNRIVILALAALALAGCSGCALFEDIPDVFDPSDETPDYTVEQKGGE